MSTKAIPFILYHYLILSWSNQKKYRNGSAVGILLPIIGVAIGVFAFIVVLSIMGGFVKDIKTELLNMQAHIRIESTEYGQQIPSHAFILDKIKSISPEIVSVLPYQSGDVILQATSSGMMANLLGLDSIPVLNKKLPARNIKNSALFPTILLGKDVLDELGLKVGESVTLVSTLPDDGPGGMGPQQLPVVIAGVLDSDSSSSDKKLVRSSLNTADLFFSTHDSWLGLRLKLKHPFLADEVSLLLSKQLPKVQNVTLKPIPWTEENRAFLKALALEHYGMSFVIGMIILVGCFSICISLLLSVRRKSKEMAILRSMGFEQLDLSKLYLIQGFCIGLIGVSIGLILGFVTLYLIHHVDLPLLTGAYSAGPLPVLISAQDVIIVSVGSLLLSMLAAVWPAIEVKKLDVIEILSIRN